MPFRPVIVHLAFLFVLACSGGARAQAGPGLIPRPVSWQTQPGFFPVSRRTVLLAEPGVPAATLALARQTISGITGMTPSISPVPAPARDNLIRLRLDSGLVGRPEGYQLTIAPNRVLITGHDDAGLFYGLQSFAQLLEQSAATGFRLRAGRIDDYPRFAYRGMQLDVSRHFFPVSFLKKYLDLLAFYKFNTFHWHLTDDQGWRIEIKRYPALQQKAAYRSQTLIGHKKELPHRFDGRRYGGYYTQDEIREVVRYATDRHITVIPEIEMPGHALAALSAYPALGCRQANGQPGGPYEAATFWGIFDDVFCAGNDSTFTFLENVLDEVISLFPSRYIHIGGDECPKVRWKSCPRCQARLRAEHLADEPQLQRYFIRRIEGHLLRRGRQLMGWDEILEGSNPALRLSPPAMVMNWRNPEGGLEALRQGHLTIMTPESHVYFDYYQSLHPDEPLAAAGYTPLSKTYAYEPLPTGLSADEARYVRGVQGNAWTEYMPTPAKAEYMIFPRALAVAELGWTPPGNRQYPDFLRRLRQHEPLLKRRRVRYADRFDELTDSVGIASDGSVQLRLRTTLPKATIRYTTDGTTPTVRSPRYDRPVSIRQSGAVKAAVFSRNFRQGRIFEQSFTVSRATGKPVTFRQSPAGVYRPASTQVAVNGVVGTARYNTGEWFGFSGTDAEATIDLLTVQTVSRIGTHVLHYPWQRMWPPTQLRFEVSTDGQAFREVFRQEAFPVNGINPVDGRFAPVQARYVRIRATSQGIIPAGSYGAGGKAWLLLDEFTVH